MEKVDVLVDRPIWRLDHPLSYFVPEKLKERVRLGSIVRVPLRGRRVRGWVVSESAGSEALEEIAGVSGPAPIFDQPLLDMCRQMARRYIHPLASFLRLLTPERTPRVGKKVPPHAPHSPQLLSEPSELWRPAPGEDVVGRYLERIRSVPESLGSIVVVPEVKEGSRVLEELGRSLGDRAVAVHSAMDPAVRASGLWAAASGEVSVLLGGRAAVWAPAFPLGAIIVHSEHDPALKEQRSPYYDAREVAAARAESAGAALLMSSLSPSLTSFNATADRWKLSQPSRDMERTHWPVVEVMEPQRTGVPRRAVALVIETSRAGGRTLFLLPRTRPTAAGPGPEQVADYLSRVVPGARIERADRPGLVGKSLSEVVDADVLVMTEAGLAEIDRPPSTAAVVLGLDAMLMRPSGLAAEEAFTALWALGALLAGNKGKGRMLLETEDPSHHVVQALSRGSYEFYARHELTARAETRSPPFTTMIRMRSAGFDTEVVSLIQGLDGVDLLGPVEGARGAEILLKVSDLPPVLDTLHKMVRQATRAISVEVDSREW